jgi:type I restriction enzyme S subunit
MSRAATQYFPVQRLKYVIDPERPITYGIVQCGPDYPGGVPYIRPADMTDEGGVEDSSLLLRTDPEIAAAYARSTVVPGDLVISIGPSFGKVMVVPPELAGANLTQGTARVAVNRPAIARFVFWALRSTVSLQHWESSVGGATFRALNLGPLAVTPIPMPDPQTQRAIADYLDRETARLDALVAAKERVLGLLAEKRRAVITRAVTRGLDPRAPLRDSGIPWLGEIPAHWESERTRWLFRERDRRSATGEEELLTVSHLTGVTPRSEKDVNMFEAETTEGYKICLAGDLVINTLWAWMGAMGVSPVHGIASPAYNVYEPGDRLEPSYVDALVRLPVFAQEVTRYSKGVWSSRLRLYPEGFFEVFLPVPSLSEQRAIVAHVAKESAKLGELRAATERTIALLKERRAALISAAVTGRMQCLS